MSKQSRLRDILPAVTRIRVVDFFIPCVKIVVRRILIQALLGIQGTVEWTKDCLR